MHPRIQNPETGEYINLFSDQVNHLLSKYSQEELISSQIQPEKYNRNTLFTNDLLYEYMLNSDINDIKNLCQIDKAANQICHSSEFWTNKMLHDNLPIHKDVNNMNEYQRTLQSILKAKKIMENKKIKLLNYKYDLSFIKNDKFKHWYKLTLEEDESFTQNIYIQFVGRYRSVLIELIDTHGNEDTIEINPTNDDMYDILVEIFYNQPDIIYK
jgi:hypothetical protein